MHDVIIVGAGPTGMMLASELRLHGIEVLVVERQAEPSLLVRSLGLHARSIEILDQRGLLGRFLKVGRLYPGAARFAGLSAPVREGAASPYGDVLGIPQPLTDRLLTARALELGAIVRRGVAVTGLEQGTDEVAVTLDDGTVERARWVVGCDGGRSTVRRILDIAFPGEPAATEWLLAELHVTSAADEVARVSEEVRRTHRGFGIGPAPEVRLPGDGDHSARDDHAGEASPLYRAVVPAASVSEDRTTPPTLDEFRAQLIAYAGTDFGAHSPRSLTRFTDATRLAERYRVGRILLAGDACHVHPPLGGQGLNLGLHDAVNLGWKLAAAIAGWAPEGLVDTYEAERRPVADEVLSLTRAQSVLMLPEPGPRAVQRLLRRLVEFADVDRFLAESVSGIGVRYDLEGPDSAEVGRPDVVGRRLGDLVLADGSRLFERQRAARGVLVDSTGALDASRWADRVDVVAAPVAELPAPAVLVRPDGHVAWAGDADARPALDAALARWFGARLP
ncbi:FAD-dependent monooxygenase [Frondihabitans australicus]|uniref:2-polyprenyl-6-methoxyphenol hydroxylase-like FAD-dependent oxidoreductase n=1 Tax=Frondihabitans australicus TaxID=386892 RepID=A0A495IIL7_9MICO|nr:FAD-dependent monooxygenase [Frondihabitans australicus]RKR74946.1 2-polyprenyl-6-methoxyphenol hydroxylase-like FAD-dependent oxidoreductase [Frondihabitans australicus]